MSFDLEKLKALALNGPVVRVVVAATMGSVPREVGASMIVGEAGLIEGTIGGGALEHDAVAIAQKALARGVDRLDRKPLGPSLGQCCGGSVTLLTEIWDGDRLERLSGDLVVRPLPGESAELPLAVSRILTRTRSGQGEARSGIVQGWMIEPVARPLREIWVWGAGHVGRAIVSVLAPLPNLRLHWADSGEERFPERLPDGVVRLVAANPADLVPLAPADAEHYVLTYSHALDLDICHRLLGRPFRFLGLIGSDTKRARFRSRLAALGHPAGRIQRMTCPIGDPDLGKHPQQIALGVATEILQRRETGVQMTGKSA